MWNTFCLHTCVRVCVRARELTWAFWTLHSYYETAFFRSFSFSFDISFLAEPQTKVKTRTIEVTKPIWHLLILVNSVCPLEMKQFVNFQAMQKKIVFDLKVHLLASGYVNV